MVDDAFLVSEYLRRTLFIVLLLLIHSHSLVLVLRWQHHSQLPSDYEVEFVALGPVVKHYLRPFELLLFEVSRYLLDLSVAFVLEKHLRYLTQQLYVIVLPLTH